MQPKSPRWHLLLKFPDQCILYISAFCKVCYMSGPSHPPWFNHLSNITWRIQLRSSSLWNFLHSPATSSLLGQNIFLSTSLPNTLSPCPSLRTRDQVPLQYKTVSNVIVEYDLIFTILGRRRSSELSSSNRFPNSNLLILCNYHLHLLLLLQSTSILPHLQMSLHIILSRFFPCHNAIWNTLVTRLFLQQPSKFFQIQHYTFPYIRHYITYTVVKNITRGLTYKR